MRNGPLVTVEPLKLAVYKGDGPFCNLHGSHSYSYSKNSCFLRDGCLPLLVNSWMWHVDLTDQLSAKE